MKIGQVASEAGVSIDTVRFYERRGVLPRAARTATGYRVFAQDAVRRIKVVRKLQELGLTLDEIGGVMAASQDNGATCESQRWRLRASLDRIDTRIADLIRLQGEVRGALAACESGSCGLLAG